MPKRQNWFFLILTGLLLFTTFLPLINAQEVTTIVTTERYALKCEFLKNPEKIIPIADKSAAFWFPAHDKKNGGFYTYVNRDGSIDFSRPYKTSIVNSRHAYGFARAYQLTGKKEYLTYARYALDFLYKNAWDEKNGGWYQEFNQDGSLGRRPFEYVNYNGRKWSFNQHYTMSGISAVYDATRNGTDWEWLKKSYDVVSTKLWDSRPGKEGYFDETSVAWGNPRRKGFTPTVDGITTHAEILYLLTLGDPYKERLLQLADNITDHLVPSMDKREFGFAEVYDIDWNIDDTSPNVSCGHMLKTAWCLCRAYLVDPNPVYLEGAEQIIKEVLDYGYDQELGGCYSDYNSITGELISDKKDWWMLEQALVAGLITHYLTGNEAYLKMADESFDFYMKHLYDSEYQEVYPNTEPDGSAPDTMKGTYWKASYHSLELYYYLYLYGNLYLHKKPVTLYYNIAPDKKQARSLTLYPIPYEKGKLTIAQVTLNGKPYKDFDSMALKLNVPKRKGGEFKVTFQPVVTP